MGMGEVGKFSIGIGDGDRSVIIEFLNRFQGRNKGTKVVLLVLTTDTDVSFLYGSDSCS